ncbi:DUF433 domain-containing protein [filamentous cyanobacterium LEGE 11480]|uniref:DUF433 domain-containing protein n=1 Tax=Romeriopsis navalis LEGE 11480 TaxID=2777977 RepID=A0A928Z5P4_9CYAN|nr:DUF433 domain-containing protein [Romeriopsis navalis]MBE9031698.1 DUF433 domain-containing protein [Romeriopsis navalis LEGE 11480]
MVATINQYVETTPGVRGGKPRISGRRITVADIAIAYLRMEQPLAQIAEEYQLSLASVHGALAYYYDHQVAIDQSIDEATAFATALQQKSRSPLAEKLSENRIE